MDAIRADGFQPDAEVDSALGIAEGIETALSLAHGFTPVWSTIDAGHLENFPLLDYVRELVLAADGHVKGDVVCQTVVLEKGAFLEGRITHRPAMNGASRTTELPARQQSRNHAGEGRPQVVVHSAEDRLAARR